MVRATRDEIRTFLARVPHAHGAFVDVLVAANLSLAAIDVFVQTMANDDASPLRMVEDTELSREIVKLNGVFGDMTDGKGNGRASVRISNVMTTSEVSRLTSVVGNFCQPLVHTKYKFGRNGHVVMNAVRRCVTGYLFGRLPEDASVVEVGPDIRHWLTDPSTREWKNKKKERKYVGASPHLTQRDVVRTTWEELAKRVRRNEAGLYSEVVLDKAEALFESYDAVFPNKRVQDVGARGEYIVSVDANYDIKFSDIPGVMVNCGARAWYGSMLRAKGLTRFSKITEGHLDLLGANFRVDWKAGRIDFRHVQCNGFGYSHDVWELMKYEELNGYVWTSSRANYVYAKGPETNDELLFFSVARVPKTIYMMQPNFVENPFAGLMQVRSVWATGGWSDGLPTKFEPVEFYVDRLAFGKVYEKRRAMDSRGDLAQTMVLVRSTNVRMWLNGTPVGASKKIDVRLADAVAVAIEVMVAQSRRVSNMSFDKAMLEYKISMERGSWLYNLLSSVVDLKAICGTIAKPIVDKWQSVRGGLIDMALSSMHDVTISARVVDAHVPMDATGDFSYIGCDEGRPDWVCACRERIFRESFEKLNSLDDVERFGSCLECLKRKDERFFSAVDDSGETSVSETSTTAVDSGSSGVEACDSDTSIDSWMEPEAECVEEVVAEKGWMSERHESCNERRAMEEFLELEKYIQRAIISEIRVDAGRLARAGCASTREVLEQCTSRTQHTLVLFSSGRLVRSVGADIPEFSAIYDHVTDEISNVVMRGHVPMANVKDGWYYTCNHMKVWNSDDVMAAVRYALDFGFVANFRAMMNVTLGVPGAGKTYGMMKVLAEEYAKTGVRFLVLSVTGKASKEAIEDGVKFGMDRKLLTARVKTLDSYLINAKFPADLVCIDEFPMAHAGRIDAAVSIAGPKVIRLFGDGRQIPYDPFTAEFDMRYSSIAGTVDSSRIQFLPMTHRLNEDVCAAWLDLYPAIFPCGCCRTGAREKKTLAYRRIGGVDDVGFRPGVRYHAYTRGERDEVIEGLRLECKGREFKLMVNSGIGTVHEDQGSTHRLVECVRLHADYDRNSSPRNPSLYNRMNYVLTDMTRHTEGYLYSSTSVEEDMVRRRIGMSHCPKRLSLVRAHAGMGLSTVEDMLANRYNEKIFQK